MKKDKGSVVLVVSILIAMALVGGGVAYYKNNPEKAGSDSMNTESSASMFSPASPKEIFIKKNTELFNANSFDEMLRINKKYSSTSKIAEDEAQMANINTEEKKQALFGFTQAMLVDPKFFTDIKEEINGDKAEVTTYDHKKQQHKATYIKENGGWKESDTKVLLNPKPKK